MAEDTTPSAMVRGLRRASCVLVLTGCQHVFGVGVPSVPDGGADASIDAPDAPDPPCYGHAEPPFIRICLQQKPDQERALSAPIATNIDVACDEILAQAGGPELCVITARAFVVNARVRVTGPRALVLVASETIDVRLSGSLDLAGRNSADLPAAAPHAGCGGMPGSSSLTLAGAGGSGGSFAHVGGAGGAGGDVTVLGGQPGFPAQPSVLRGGCSGKDGGRMGSTTPQGGGSGGFAGGAIYLLAGKALSIEGEINASGAGGKGGDPSRGGGGGGSGGMIVLEAPTIAIQGQARVFAIGGGGGGGGGDNNGGTGSSSMGPEHFPLGGSGGGTTVKGGGGGGTTRAMPGIVGETGTPLTGGGGGGGGASGVIRMYPSIPTPTLNVDPPAT